MTKKVLQHMWWAFVRGSRAPPVGSQVSTAPQFGKHCSKGTVVALYQLGQSQQTWHKQTSIQFYTFDNM